MVIDNILLNGIDLTKRELIPANQLIMPPGYRPDLKGVLISRSEIKQRIDQIALALSNHYQGEEVEAIVVMNGSVPFYTDLMLNQNISFVHNPSFRKAKSYIGKKSSGEVLFNSQDLNQYKGKNVLFIEDIIDTGNTMSKVMNIFREVGANNISVCTLLDKPSRREVNFTADFIGFTIPNEFVVGYGLDFDDKYRGIPHIGVLKEEVYQH